MARPRRRTPPKSSAGRTKGSGFKVMDTAGQVTEDARLEQKRQDLVRERNREAMSGKGISAEVRKAMVDLESSDGRARAAAEQEVAGLLHRVATEQSRGDGIRFETLSVYRNALDDLASPATKERVLERADELGEGFLEPTDQPSFLFGQDAPTQSLSAPLATEDLNENRRTGVIAGGEVIQGTDSPLAGIREAQAKTDAALELDSLLGSLTREDISKIPPDELKALQEQQAGAARESRAARDAVRGELRSRTGDVTGGLLDNLIRDMTTRFENRTPTPTDTAPFNLDLLQPQDIANRRQRSVLEDATSPRTMGIRNRELRPPLEDRTGVDAYTRIMSNLGPAIIPRLNQEIARRLGDPPSTVTVPPEISSGLGFMPTSKTIEAGTPVQRPFGEGNPVERAIDSALVAEEGLLRELRQPELNLDAMDKARMQRVISGIADTAIARGLENISTEDMPTGMNISDARNLSDQLGAGVGPDVTRARSLLQELLANPASILNQPYSMPQSINAQGMRLTPSENLFDRQSRREQATTDRLNRVAAQDPLLTPLNALQRFPQAVNRYGVAFDPFSRQLTGSLVDPSVGISQTGFLPSELLANLYANREAARGAVRERMLYRDDMLNALGQRSVADRLESAPPLARRIYEEQAGQRPMMPAQGFLDNLRSAFPDLAPEVNRAIQRYEGGETLPAIPAPVTTGPVPRPLDLGQAIPTMYQTVQPGVSRFARPTTNPLLASLIA